MSGPHPVALCATCLVDQFMPEIGVATVKVLRRAGYAVDFPKEQTCCGQPFFNSGFRRQAVTLAIRTIEIFEPYPAVILPSGSCTAMIRIEYPHLLAEQPPWRRRAEKLAQRTFELSEFLVREGTATADGRPPAIDHRPPYPESAIRNPQSSAVHHLSGDTPAYERANDRESSEVVSYHDSCHMRRLLGLRDEPRTALASYGCSLREIDPDERCCGFGGLFSWRLPEIAGAMSAEKLRHAAETRAPLVTADPGCLLQLRGQAAGSGVQIEHLAVTLERRSRPAGGGGPPGQSEKR